MFIAITGKLGSGKSLLATNMAKDYARKKRRVVANFPIDFSTFRDVPARHSCEVLPDKPTSSDLLALGRGGENEHKAGLLIVDEGARWLNARSWSGQDRDKVIDWLLHSRKLGWDVVVIVQHHNMLDKQVREGLMELVVRCQRFDRLRVPVLGLKLPQLHLAVARYGVLPHDPVAFRRFYHPKSMAKAYDTQAIFTESNGAYCMLSRWHLVERYKDRINPLYLLLLLVLWLSVFVAALFSREARVFYVQRIKTGVPQIYGIRRAAGVVAGRLRVKPV